ncbi:RNA polymerase sigma-70 factor (ECF subfamily) [Chitinophaga niastensis]|uniref:RNA polymerase sigma-70 factor (ECF subfamily) n=1 Tax=Chitinophaga niastensis TaxID=536980 RepID=A0A2P8HF09_CHINA|nr:sigma-70 family RNA polymerase sigma factor [Chitinophaga niastensis]PSL44781.1 RNA polymerase sigma-70 factor (ECF subfamily) [Chitinophaga niastensis]
MNSDQPKPSRDQPVTGYPGSETAANVILWNRVRQNDQEALVGLYEHLYLQLVNYGIRICSDVELTKDAINDMFLEIWDQRQKLHEVSNVKSYLFTYLRRKIFAGIRQTKKSLLAADVFSDDTSPHELSYEECIVAVQATEEIKQKIKRAISRLTPRQKELVQLRYFDGLSMEEVGKRAGITTKTAYNTLGFALKTLSVEFMIWVILSLF